MARAKDGVVEYLTEMDDDPEEESPLAVNEGDTPSVPDEAAEETPEDAAPEEESEHAADHKESKIDLTALPEFRRYQAERDRELAELRERLARTEQTQQAVNLQQIAAEIEQIYLAAEDAEDPNERRRLLKEAGKREGYLQYMQWKQWDDHKTRVVREHGLDPADPRFQKQYRSAEEFERDVLQAELEKYRKELAALKGESPAQRRQQARAAMAGKHPVVDTGEPEDSVDRDEAFARDVALLQSGRLKPQKFVAKWGNR